MNITGVVTRRKNFCRELMRSMQNFTAVPCGQAAA